MRVLFLEKHEPILQSTNVYFGTTEEKNLFFVQSDSDEHISN